MKALKQSPLKAWIFPALALLLTCSTQAQQPQKLAPGEIHQAIKKLNFLGSALYVAAHPDDENTRLISYLSNEVHARTAYLSLTRGDGGQNLIGPELKELLGVIRTNELLMARSVDGGEQMFTRANDFGYSKHPDETMDIWNRDAVLSDVVWAIRKFKPDVIVNRFDHNSAGRTHGHHTASAVLANEAFGLAGDATQYPDQLSYYRPWQAKRQFFNTSWWFYGSREKFEEADKGDMVAVDVGVYYPYAGKSNTEIASLSRSMHKCQGFGSTGTRGSQEEYLQLVNGDMPNDNDIFDGINTSWTRVKGGDKVGMILKQVEGSFNHEHPEYSVPQLVKAYELIVKLEDRHWREIKTEEIKKIIAACAGLYLEAAADTPHATTGSELTVSVEAINRSELEMTLKSVSIRPSLKDTTLNSALGNNQKLSYDTKIKLLNSHTLTAPYWLQEKGQEGMYKVDNQLMIGLPSSPRAIRAWFLIEIEGVEIEFDRDVIYKFNDPEKGEVYRPFEIVPTASVSIQEDVVLFPNAMTKEVQVIVKSGEENIKGEVHLQVPKRWKVEPEMHDVDIEKKGDSRAYTFTITPPKLHGGLKTIETTLSPIVVIGSDFYNKSLIEIDYAHIPYQSVLLPAVTKMVRFDLQKGASRIGYVMGAGDAIPEMLEEVGYEVIELDVETLTLEQLKEYETVVMGIRAYNKWEALTFKQSVLMEFVNQGGTLISQYNTTWNRKLDEIGPYPFHISRDRVTMEDAEVRFLEPDHAVLNTPNTITQDDFENWVQERGLYFADEWDDAYTPILSANDPDEDPRNGGLLIAKYGEGTYVYTGYSFFRELPAGVPGAYRLLANILAL